MPVVFAAPEGYVSSQVIFHEIDINESFLGPVYLVDSEGNSTGSIGLVLMHKTNKWIHEDVRLEDDDGEYFAYINATANESIRAHDMYFNMNSIFKAGERIIQEFDFWGEDDGLEVEGTILANLENISGAVNPKYTLEYNNETIGKAEIVYELREAQPDPVYISKTVNVSVSHADGSAVQHGRLKIHTKLVGYGTYWSYAYINNGTATRTSSYRNGSGLLVEVNGEFIYNETIISSDPVTLSYTLPQTGFADGDQDTVPDIYDKCPSTKPGAEVDDVGCSCDRLSYCQNCDIVDGKAQCLDSCYNGRKDYNEEDVDCGGPCGSCEQCDAPNTCISKPGFCNANKRIESNCEECGCPEGTACSEGKCLDTIKLSGLKCKLNRVEYSFGHMDCASLGPTWHEENVPGLVSVNVEQPKMLALAGTGLGFLGGPAGPLIGLVGGLFGSKAIGDKTKDAIQNSIEAVTVCVDTEDQGCVPKEISCWDEDNLKEHLPEIQNKMQAEANRILSDSIPSAGRAMGLKADVSINLNKVELSVPYQCDDGVVDVAERCSAVIENGPSSKKADILIIGAGFMTEEDLKSKVLEVLDYDSTRAGTSREGLFSIEPFKSNKDRFNVWIVPAQNRIKHVYDETDMSSGRKPVEKDVHKEALKCAHVNPEFTLVLSKSSFRSHCFFGEHTRPCSVSLSSTFPGRLFAHEFGHGFGHLADEYHNHVEPIEQIDLFEAEKMLAGPNCKVTQADAEKAWGDLVDEDIGYFKGCGGDCSDTCEDFIRPTQNSMMRYQGNRKGAQDCNTPLERGTLSCQGPPFDPWYGVNERQLNIKFSQYSKAPEINETPEVNETINQTINQTINETNQTLNNTCTETDGGLNPEVKGTTSGRDPYAGMIYNVFHDDCVAPDRVRDFICNDLNDPTGLGYITRHISACDFACQDGACVDKKVYGVSDLNAEEDCEELEGDYNECDSVGEGTTTQACVRTCSKED